MKKLLMRLFLLLSALLFFSDAVAAGSGVTIPPPGAMPHWYVGAGANKLAVNRLTNNRPSRDLLVVDGNSRYGFQIFVGHQQNNYFAVELGYVNAARLRVDAIDKSPAVSRLNPSNSNYRSARIWETYLQGLFRYPVIGDNLFILVKGGVAFLNSDSKLDYITDDDSDQVGSTSTFAFTYSAGVEYGENNWGIRFAYNGFVSTTYFIFRSRNFPHLNYVDLSLIYRFGT